MIIDDFKNLIEIIVYLDVYAIFYHCFCSFKYYTKSVPGFEDETLGAVFSVLAQLVVFQHTDSFL